jgi:hypothetical protein
MKEKTIRNVLTDKCNEWLASIVDGNVRAMARKDVVITGGCIASMLLKEPVNDYDIYFKTPETVVAVATYYAARFKERSKANYNIEVKDEISEKLGRRITVYIKSAGVAGEAPNEEEETLTPLAAPISEPEKTTAAAPNAKVLYEPVFMSSNAITLSGKIQIVLRFWGEPEEIHSTFDFVHCTNFWHMCDGVAPELVLNKEALASLLTKELVYMGSKYPICSIIRLRKFIKRGWQVHAGYILKMVMQSSELDLKDVEILKDQLTGVDSAYFANLIYHNDLQGKAITSTVIGELIDKMMKE